MKQVVQSFRTGELSITDVPAPRIRGAGILVRTRASAVSSGTERMVLEFAEKNLVEKALARPDLVRQVIDKVRRDGLVTTIQNVRGRLEELLPLGYSLAGEVVDVGSEEAEFRVGQRVACSGSGYASHAEIVYVPRNLAVPLPDAVTFDAGAFVTLGAIAMHGLRQAAPHVGERVAIIGLGLLGQLTAQIAKAAGCTVFGVDLQPERVQLALDLAADVATVAADAEDRAHSLAPHGFDAVVITADTSSDEPLVLAGKIARDRATVVAVGAIGMKVPRRLYYQKELTLRISRSAGPGRYDPTYEDRGVDYPIGFVRWTEQRNMEAFLRLVASGAVKVEPLITHRFPIENATGAYELLRRQDEPFLGVVLQYPGASSKALEEKRVALLPYNTTPSPGTSATLRVGVSGAGNFAKSTLLPALRKIPDVTLRGIASGSGVPVRAAADKFGFAYCATDFEELLRDPLIDVVAILTRHSAHASQVVAALAAGKHVFVEKPLCLDEEELGQIVRSYESSREAARRAGSRSPELLVGFNRRFAPFVVELEAALRSISEPVLMHYRVNAGYIPREHWIQDRAEGGGRILGEVCHFIDLLLHLTASRVKKTTTVALPNSGRYSNDNVVVTLEFDSGSIGTVTYVASGDRSFGKERLEVFGGGISAELDDFRALRISRAGRERRRVSRFRQDKGHQAQWQAFAAALLRGDPSPVPFAELVESTRATFAAHRSLLEERSITPGDVTT